MTVTAEFDFPQETRLFLPWAVSLLREVAEGEDKQKEILEFLYRYYDKFGEYDEEVDGENTSGSAS